MAKIKSSKIINEILNRKPLKEFTSNQMGTILDQEYCITFHSIGSNPQSSATSKKLIMLVRQQKARRRLINGKYHYRSINMIL